MQLSKILAKQTITPDTFALSGCAQKYTVDFSVTKHENEVKFVSNSAILPPDDTL